MFGIDNTKFRSGPHVDFRHLVISGKKCSQPNSSCRTRKETFDLFPAREIDIELNSIQYLDPG